jgi:hypothetical protein
MKLERVRKDFGIRKITQWRVWHRYYDTLWRAIVAAFASARAGIW